MDFKIDGLEQMISTLKEGYENFQSEKEKELMKIGLIAESEIKPLVPVDTSRLRNSIATQLLDSDSVETGTNVEYSLPVNDGHMTRGAKVPDSSAYRGIRKHKQGKFVKGTFFMQKGMNNAKFKIEKELNQWGTGLMDKIAK